MNSSCMQCKNGVVLKAIPAVISDSASFLARTLVFTLAWGFCAFAWSSTPEHVGPEVTEFAVDPRNAEVVLAATRYGVFRSTDGGSAWSQLGAASGLPKGLAWSLVTHEASGHVYAVFEFEGVYRSQDGGNQWARLAQPIHASNDHAAFRTSSYALAIQPAADSPVLLLGTGNGIFRSADAGRSWAHVHVMEGIMVRGIAFDPSDLNRAVAGVRGAVLTSEDAGRTWRRADSDTLAPFQSAWFGDFTARKHPKPALLVNAAGRTLLSEEGSSAWRLFHSCGRTAVAVSGLLLRACPYPYLRKATAEHGVSKSIDAGATWEPINHGLPQSWGASTLYAHPVWPSTFFVGWAAGRVFRTENGGESWADVSKGLTWCDLAKSEPRVMAWVPHLTCPVAAPGK